MPYAHDAAIRYDTRGDFTDQQSWRAVDAGKTDGLDSRGFNGGAFDGRYLYMAAWDKGEGEVYNIKGHGIMLRYDTTGKQASYCLNYAACGHNGGLNAAVPGAAFMVAMAYLKARGDTLVAVCEDDVVHPEMPYGVVPGYTALSEDIGRTWKRLPAEHPSPFPHQPTGPSIFWMRVARRSFAQSTGIRRAGWI